MQINASYQNATFMNTFKCKKCVSMQQIKNAST